MLKFLRGLYTSAWYWFYKNVYPIGRKTYLKGTGRDSAFEDWTHQGTLVSQRDVT